MLCDRASTSETKRVNFFVGEWKGPWSDGSDEWMFIEDGEKEAHGIVFEDDGEFFMSKDDFLKHFDSLEVCHLSPEMSRDDEGSICWHEQHINSSWYELISCFHEF